MVEEILNSAGIKNKPTRFLKPPNCTYAVWFDRYSKSGADMKKTIYNHSCSIELYSYEIDNAAERAIERELDKRALEYTKQERVWLQSEQLWEVIYTFDYKAKEAL